MPSRSPVQSIENKMHDISNSMAIMTDKDDQGNKSSDMISQSEIEETSRMQAKNQPIERNDKK